MTQTAEGQRLPGPDLPQFRFVSRFLMSGCCAAPVWVTLDLESATYPVLCTACGRTVGCPGFEDLEREDW